MPAPDPTAIAAGQLLIAADALFIGALLALTSKGKQK